MNVVTATLRGLGMLFQEKWLTIGLILANIFVALVQLLEPVLFGRVVDALSLGNAAFAIIGLWAIIGLFSMCTRVILAVFADRLAHRMRLLVLDKAFVQAIHLPADHALEDGAGGLFRTLLSGTDTLFWLWLNFLRDHLAALVNILILIPTAIYMQPQMAAILCALAGIYAIANVLIIHRTIEGQSAVETYQQHIFGRAADVLGNVTVVQSFSRLQAEALILRQMMSQLLRAQYPVLTWWAVITVLTRAAATLTMVSLFALGGHLANQGLISVGEIVSFAGFATLLIGNLEQISGFIARSVNQSHILPALFGLLQGNRDTEDVSAAKALVVREDGCVRFNEVSFSYPDGTVGVRNLSFEARRGQIVALVGPSGSGKTTAMKLLQRLRKPDSGCITIDDQDIAEVTLQSLRKAQAVVFQDAGLFNRSIRDNIQVGKPEADQDAIVRAAQLAGAHAFIQEKPGQYDFVVGERGALLSGGERQRITIARAIIRDAPIRILDEATSALDAETELNVKQALESIKSAGTTFVIAHRLSTVAHADKILVFDQGTIRESGSYSQLLQFNGIFARMIREGGFVAEASV